MFREREKSFDNSMVQTGERKSCHFDIRSTKRHKGTKALGHLQFPKQTSVAS